MFLRGDYWHYDFLAGGERFRGSTGFKENEKDKAKEAEERLKVQARDKHSVELIWEQTKRKLISAKEVDFDFNSLWNSYSKKSSSSAADHRVQMAARSLRLFCEWIKENYPDIKKVSYIEPHHAQEWFNALRKETGSNSTKNDHLVSVKAVFATLGKASGIIENPFAEVKKLKKNSPSRSAFTPEELALIGKNATGWIYSLCLTAISTGLREGDICTLKKSSVNLSTGWILIPKTLKTGASVEIPILLGLKRHLQERFEEEPESEFVFPELAEIYYNDSTIISKGIKKFFESIGISETTKAVAGYKRKLSNKDVHSFRHTFVYLAACHGIPFPIVQGIVGHASPEMTKHYMDHAGREAKSKYLHQLPDYLTGKTPILQIKDEGLVAKKKRLADLAYTLSGPSLDRVLGFIDSLSANDTGDNGGDDKPDDHTNDPGHPFHPSPVIFDDGNSGDQPRLAVPM